MCNFQVLVLMLKKKEERIKRKIKRLKRKKEREGKRKTKGVKRRLTMVIFIQAC